MIVVDTNVVSYLLIEGENTSLAQDIYRRDKIWLLPPIWRHEFLNVISSYIRFGGISEKVGRECWTRGIAMFGGIERETDMLKALGLSVNMGISAYDAQYVVLAREMQTRLITEDRKLLAAFPDLAQSMEGCLNAANPKGL
ncbi:MAG TPA: type II toxin-antitoxin system VapC family toxin [Anaerolineales bacterium]|nr:type II toxin-antitoxin system VapC family toxin [Anaerolineales bacterium]